MNAEQTLTEQIKNAMRSPGRNSFNTRGQESPSASKSIKIRESPCAFLPTEFAQFPIPRKSARSAWWYVGSTIMRASPSGVSSQRGL